MQIIQIDDPIYMNEASSIKQEESCSFFGRGSNGTATLTFRIWKLFIVDRILFV